MSHARINGEDARERGCVTMKRYFTAANQKGGVIAGHSRPKDGVASLAYDPAIHPVSPQ